MRTKKFIVALCFSFFMFMCSVSTVYAYNTYNQHKLTYGVGNYGKDTQHYFITSSASGYASYINTAMEVQRLIHSVAIGLGEKYN